MRGDRVGQRLGDYHLTRVLGQGAFADVYLAEQVYDHTPAAVKVFKKTLTGEQEFEDFLNEARAFHRLKHPHIVPLLDFHRDDQKIPYLVLGYAPGGSLRQRYPKGTQLSLTTVISYVQQVALALQFVHENRLIHRDVKPDNLLLGPDNTVWLGDFNIVVAAHSSVSFVQQNIVGTASYMAPEQWEGKPCPASDQYALAVVTYEWLTGERPFTGTFIELPGKHANHPPPPLREKRPDLSSEIEQVVLTALAKEPKERFTSVQTFAEALDQAVQKSVAGTVEQTPSQVRQRFAVGTTLFTYEHPCGEMHSLIWSPTGKSIASGGDDATVRIWDALDGRLLSTYTGHKRSIVTVAWSPDGSHIASVEDGQVQVWEVTSGQLLCSFLIQIQRRYSSQSSVVWSPKGNRIASIDGTQVQVWEVTSGQLLCSFPASSSYQRRLAVAWSPDERYLAAIHNRVVQVWDVTSSQQLLMYADHKKEVSVIAWSPKNNHIASVDNYQVRVWDALSGKLLDYDAGFSNFARAVAWSPDGNRLVWGNAKGTILIKNISPDQHSDKRLRSFKGHKGKITVIVWSSDGNHILVGHETEPSRSQNKSHPQDAAVQVWDSTSGEAIHTFPDTDPQRQRFGFGIETGMWSPDGNHLAAVNDGIAQVWNISSDKPLFLYAGHASTIKAVAWSPDGKYLASSSDNGILQVRDVLTEQLLHSYRLTRTSDEYEPPALLAIGWSPDGSCFVLGYHRSNWNERRVHVWNVSSNQQLFTYEVVSCDGAAWSPSGDRIAIVTGSSSWGSTNGSKNIRIFSALSGELQISYSGYQDASSVISWSPDGSRLALGYNDGTVQVYELSSGRLLTYSSYQTTGAWSSGKQRPVQSIAWSLDGSRIVSSSADGTVVVRDTAFDQPLLSYPGRGGGLQSVALSPNGENLASFGLDSTVRVSNAFTGVPVFTYHGHRRSVRVVAWSPDGKYIASAGDEVHIWQAR